MKKFCPSCGKEESETAKLIQGLCRNCVSEKTKLLKEYKPLKIVICSKCNSYLHQNKWYEELSNREDVNIIKVVKKLLPDKLKFGNGIKIEDISINLLVTDTKGKKNLEIELSLEGSIQGVQSKESHILDVIKEDAICNSCKKKGSSYFEAIIQIRPKDKKLLNFIEQDLSSDRNTHISKEETKKFGYDLYITSKSYIKNIIPKVKKEFDVEIKISKTLYGQKDGKEVYRITALIRLKE